MNLIQELQRIYDSEINYSISSFDSGFVVRIGDTLNGFPESDNFDTIKECVLWIIDRAVVHYPNSKYAFIRISLINKYRSGLMDTDKFTPEFLLDLLQEYEISHPGIYSQLEREYQKDDLPTL